MRIATVLHRGLAAGVAAVSIAAVAACAGDPAQVMDGNAPQTITVAMGSKPDTLDPDLAASFTDTSAMHLIAGTLFNLRGNGESSPGLAAAVHVSPDGLTQTYALRPNLRFSDGSPLTASDVVATIERSMNDKSNGYAGFLSPVAGVSAPDANTVVFTLRRPYPSLPTIVGYPVFTILPARDLNPAAGMAKNGFFANPVSAGPYKLSSWGGGRNETFTANPYYWGPKPLVPTVRFVTISDFNTSVSELRAKQVDVSTAVPPALIPTLERAAGIQVLPVEMYGSEALLTNDAAPPLNDVRVRQAISLAIDRNQIVRSAFYGKNVPLTGFWPSTVSGYAPAASNGADPERAKGLLAQTQCAAGCSIKLIYESDDQPWATQAAVIVQTGLAAVGIKVDLVQVDLATIYADLTGGKYQMTIGGNFDYANVPDGLAAYSLLNGGDIPQASGYNSPQMNQLIAKADESTGAARADALRAIESLFVKDQPYVSIADFVVVDASRLPQNVVSIGASGFIDIGTH